MPTVTLTARNVPRLSPAGDARGEYWDASLPGFGLRVTPSRVRTWTIRYRHEGRLYRMTIGRYPKLSLADAREKGRKELRRAGLGQHPAGEKLTARDREADTIAALIEAYEKHASKRKGWIEEKRILNAEILPAWRNRLARQISRRDVRALVDEKALTAPIMANRLLAEVSRLFNFALDREWIEANPAHRMTRPSAEQSRDRVLSVAELQELWSALHEASASRDGKPVARLTPTLNDAFVTMLLTAQRSGEVCRMHWSDVELEAGWWTLPGTATKNGSDHRVPLTNAVVDLLGARLQVAKADADFVFSTRQGTSVAARAKKAASRLSTGLSFAFRAHDLRRTAASGMGEAGVPREHIAHVLNHRSVTHASITAIYDRYSYDREKRQALETWDRKLSRILSDDRATGRVISMSAHC
jgi:integrase